MRLILRCRNFEDDFLLCSHFLPEFNVVPLPITMVRGGVRHIGAPSVDRNAVFDVLKRHASLLADMGRYEQKSRADACDGAGLVHLAPLLGELLRVAGSGWRLRPFFSLKPHALRTDLGKPTMTI